MSTMASSIDSKPAAVAIGAVAEAVEGHTKKRKAAVDVKREEEQQDAGDNEPIEKKKKKGIVERQVEVTPAAKTGDVKPKVAKKGMTMKTANAASGVASGSGSGTGNSNRSPNGSKNSGLKIGDVLHPGEGQLDYTITQPEPTRDAVTGDFHFDDCPAFRPNCSPEEIIRAGSFGGGYWRVITSSKTGITYRHFDDLPKRMPYLLCLAIVAWYAGVNKGRNMTQMKYDLTVNKWGCKVGQTYDEWDDAGWFRVEHDSRGWFHWYCRYFVGRRCDDDERQISRWVKIASPKSGRWRRILLGKYLSAGATTISPSKETITKGIRQTLFHWGFDPTTAHLAAFIKEKS